MKNYNSVADALDDLKNREYNQTFRREPTSLYCIELHLWITPGQFSVDEFYHFEDNASPDADRLLYAISSIVGIKGILVDTYGVYADNMSLEMAQKLRTRKEQQINFIKVDSYNLQW